MRFTQVMSGGHMQVPKCAPLLRISETTGRIVLVCVCVFGPLTSSEFYTSHGVDKLYLNVRTCK